MKKLRIFFCSTLLIPIVIGISSSLAVGQNWYSLDGGAKILNRSDPPFSAVQALCVYNNKLYVGGDFDTLGGLATGGLAQWDGTSWDTVEGGMKNVGAGVMIEYNNNLIASGGFAPIFWGASIAQWNGHIWDTLGPGLGTISQSGPYIGTMAVYNGSLYVAGDIHINNFNNFNNNIVKWNGTNWDTILYGNSFGNVYTMQAYNNKLYVGGYFNYAGLRNIAVWNDTNWSNLNGVADSEVAALTVLGGKLYAGGFFKNIGGVPVNNVAVFDGNNWSPVGTGVNNGVWDMCTYNNKLIVAGNFDSAGGIACNQIAQWNDTTWAPLGSGISKGRAYTGVYTMCEYNGSLYAEGKFDSAGGIKVNNIARWGPVSVGKASTQLPKASIAVYPNPSNGQFNFVMANEAKQSQSTLEVYNMLGEKVYSQVIVHSSSFIVDLNTQPNGIYLYRVTDNNGSLIGNGKLVIQK